MSPRNFLAELKRRYSGSIRSGTFTCRSRFPKALRGKAAVNLRDFGQPLIPTGKRSGLQTHIAATESVSLCERMKS
jgi:hypothetical protein